MPDSDTKERRVVKQDTFHKWVGTCAVIVALAWGGLAYYVKAEDNQTRLILQSQINMLQSQQQTDLKVQELVIVIDKRLAVIEGQLSNQKHLVEEVRNLRMEVNELKLELAKR